MKHEPAVIRIAHDLCKLLDDEWSEGRKLYLAKAQEIYDREIKPLADHKTVTPDDSGYSYTD